MIMSPAMRKKKSALGPRGVGGVAYGDQQTLTLQPDSATAINAVMNSATPTAHNHSAPNMIIGEPNSATDSVNRLLMKFDLSGLPDNALLDEVTLTLNCNGDFSDNARTLSIYRMKIAWTKTGVTWNKYDGVTDWPGGAGGFGSVDCEQTPIATRDMSASESLTDKIITFTPTSKAALDLGYGWMLRVDTEVNDGYRFAMADNGTAANRPELIIKYRVPL